MPGPAQEGEADEERHDIRVAVEAGNHGSQRGQS
jgi:hypothetical protein